ncbi:hypothetical protein HK102_005799, partial [Quaeritorhiza haematococci]
MEKEGKHMHGLFGSNDTHVAKGAEIPNYKKRYEVESEEAEMTQRSSEWAMYFVNQAKKLKPGLITRFFICLQDRFLEQQRRAASLDTASDMNITAYCEYQTMFKGAQRYHLRALSEIRAFLSHVKSGRDGHNPNTYPSFLERITVADEAASKCFSNLIDKYPKSLPVVRLYARFVTTVKSDPELAKKLTVLVRQLCGDNDEPTSVKTILPNSPLNDTNVTSAEQESSVAGPISLQMHSARRSSHMSHTNVHTASVGLEQQEALQEWVGAVVNQSQYDSKPVLEADEDTLDLDCNMPAITSNPEINLDEAIRPALPSSVSSMQLEDRKPYPLRVSISQPRLDEKRPAPLHPSNSQTYLEQRQALRTLMTQPKARWPEQGKDVVTGVATAPQYPTTPPAPQASQVVDVLEKAMTNSEHSDMSEKNRRLKVHKRRQMSVLLKRGIERFSIYQICVLLWKMALVGAAYGISVYVFTTAQENVAGLTSSIRMGRRAIETATYLRYMYIYSLLNDTTAFDNERRKLNNTLQILENISLPYLRKRIATLTDTAQVEVIRPPAPVPEIEDLNAYEMLSNLVDVYRDMLNQNMSALSNMKDYRHHYVIRNIATIRDFLAKVRDEGEQEYRYSIDFGAILMGVVIGLAGVTVVVWTMAIFYPVLTKTQRDQIQYLKAFALVPKKDLMNMLVDIDEAIEEITEDMATCDGDGDVDDHVNVKALTNQNDLKDRVTASWMRNYIIAVVVLGLAVVGMLIIPLVRVESAKEIVRTITYAGGRRVYAYNVNYYATEVTIQDTSFWLPRQLETQLDHWIHILEELHKNTITGSGKQEITPLSSMPALRSLLVEAGVCSRTDPYGCDPKTRDPPYVPEIGYTKETAMSPIDTVLNRYIAEAQMFLERRMALPEKESIQRNLTDFVSNPHLLFMRGVVQDIVEGLDKVQDVMFALMNSENDTAEQEVTVIMSLIVTLAAFLYLAIFARFSRQRLSQADEIVNLLFIIPQQVVDTKSELK